MQKKWEVMMMMMMMMNCFYGMVDRRKVLPDFQPGPLSEIHTIANLRHAASRQATERGCSIVKCGKMLSVGGL